MGKNPGQYFDKMKSWGSSEMRSRTVAWDCGQNDYKNDFEKIYLCSEAQVPLQGKYMYEYECTIGYSD